MQISDQALLGMGSRMAAGAQGDDGDQIAVQLEVQRQAFLADICLITLYALLFNWVFDLLRAKRLALRAA